MFASAIIIIIYAATNFFFVLFLLLNPFSVQVNIHYQYLILRTFRITCFLTKH